MSESVRVATPLDFLPRYLCPHCNVLLRYDDVTNGETYETGAQCDVCGRSFIVTGTSTLPHPDGFSRGGHAFAIREVSE